MDLSHFGKWVFWVGVLIAGIGLFVWWGPRIGLPLGRLPGDIHISGERWSFYFPIMSCIVLSIVLTVVLNIFFRFFR
ncbi:MAG: DUF2905 domain-containing protein [Thermoguttaceae bacterium]|nr:DUF2905 domain-containing protein [Thermoguttaceae bacterium]MDW8078811.1 DUF2905 domain-containing protein [Thermoguttaceae bacterium]